MEYYILNTNRKLDPSGHDEFTMLDEQIASAYRNNKGEINKLKLGDMVFLYRVSQGVIAYGTVYSDLRTRSYKNQKGEEHYRLLTHFYWFPENPIPAKKINGLGSYRVSFQQTMVKIIPTIGKALLNECEGQSKIARAA